MKKKQRKNRSKFIDRIIQIVRKHGEYTNWVKVGKEVGTTPQNAREVYTVWVRNNG